jgi:hypothetical protein
LLLRALRASALLCLGGVGFRSLEFGCRSLEFGCRSLELGFRSLEFGCRWSWVVARWSLVFARWSWVVAGVGLSLAGAWFSLAGVCFAVPGIFCKYWRAGAAVWQSLFIFFMLRSYRSMFYVKAQIFRPFVASQTVVVVVREPAALSATLD